MRSPGPLALVALLLAAAAPAAAAVTGPRDQMLVTPAWLKAHLGDPKLVLFHIGDRAGYEQGHIPGARHLESRRFSWRSGDSLSLELPPSAWLDSSLATLGVSNDSRVVLYYGSDWVTPTTRAWFTFDYLGLGPRTSILDGGMPAWTAAGGAVTADLPPAAVPGRLRSTPHPERVASAATIQGSLGRPGFRLVDARNTEFFLGFNPGAGSRPGHLPGAISLVYESVVDSANRFLPDTALARLFRSAGVAPGDQLVAYCHIGQQATAVVFAARLLGYDVRLYDGSFQDWSRRSALPLEVALAPTTGGLMSTADLAARLRTGRVTVIDARSDLNAYLADHLPGASYLHFESLRAVRHGVPGDLLTLEGYAALWARLGVRRDQPVVIYGSGEAGNFNATFVAWLLTGFRQPEVYVLDGGYARWTAEARERTRRYPEIAAVDYRAPAFFPEVLTTEHMTHVLGDPGTVIVDVRPADQYAGVAGAQLRRGHIPGAVHHFWRDDLTAGAEAPTWKPVEELRQAYLAQGITPDKQVVVYCNTGTEASHAWFTLHFLLGYPAVRVYVPSWTEWAAREELPIETGVGASR